MAQVSRFEDLKVWQDAVELFAEIYMLSETGKLKQDFGMKDQFKRAGASISNNIEEGFEYNSTAAFIKYLIYSKGSCGEVRNQLHLLKRVKLIDDNVFNDLIEKTLILSKRLSSFISYLKKYKNNSNE